MDINNTKQGLSGATAMYLSDLLVDQKWFDQAVDGKDLGLLLFDAHEQINKTIPEGEVDIDMLTLKELTSLARGHLKLKCALEEMAKPLVDDYINEISESAFIDDQIHQHKQGSM